MFFVYVLRSEVDNRLYVGFTESIERRVKEHNCGKTRSTKGYIPWNLVYTEEIFDRKSARIREKYLKSGFGKEYLKKILAP
ncbi:MAG: GIY-YIG nuclease family protein [Bacteroidota bacterium]